MKLDKPKSMDIQLLVIVLVLVMIGLIMIFSASSIMAGERFGDPFFFLKRQMIWLVIGCFAMCVGMYFDYSYLQKISFPILILSIILLILVTFPSIGVCIGGARRWIRLGFIGFQPSEFAKLSLIIYTAGWIDRKQSRLLKGYTVYIPKLFIVGIILFLIYIEPDLGTTALLFVIVLALHYAGGLKLKYLTAVFIASIPGLYYAILSSPYRRRRLFAFLNPWDDAQGSGYQIIQSLLALGSGGITGVGIGSSKLKLLYLPEPHTDFIYPIIAEELGLIGSLGVILLFAYLCYRGVKISLFSRDLFGRLLAFGLIMMIAFQAMVNIAVTTGMLPTKGMPLPFISFGGSSLVVMLFSVGVILNISKHRIEE